MKVKNRAIGSVCELVAHGAGKYITEFAVEREDGSEIATYDTIDELQKYWETYMPTKPLIEDEKTRKVFREWAEIHSAEHFKVTHLFNSKGHLTLIRSTDITAEPSIELPNHIGKDLGGYTRTELCGTPPEPLEPTFVDLDERIKGKEGK